MTPLIEARGLTKHFSTGNALLAKHRPVVRALESVDLSIERRECFALVGESGSGKTTLGRCLMRLIEPTRGQVLLDGEDLTALRGRELRRRRRRFQMIFQDPYGSLNPRMRVSSLLEEPLAVHRLVPKEGRPRRCRELLDMVGLPASALDRFPHEFSGGQRQRIGIARALATEPEFLVADEPVSALDVSVRAQVINLLYSLQQELGLTLLFIAHDLALVEQIADRVAVMYLGRIVEVLEARHLLDAQHPYSVSLLSSVPLPDPKQRRGRIVLGGELPSATAPPSGCAFHPRCPVAQQRCREVLPTLQPLTKGGLAACHYPGELQREVVPNGTFSPQSRSEN